MRFKRLRHGPEQVVFDAKPVETADRVISSVKWKADDNEFWARFGSAVMMAATAAIPVCVVLSTHWQSFVFGKVLPATLAAFAAWLAGRLQFDKPHERWTLYRGYQRVIEMERLRYENRVGQYAAEERDALFINRLAELQLELHDDWAHLVPKSSEVASQHK
jgi:hypothetical protein